MVVIVVVVLGLDNVLMLESIEHKGIKQEPPYESVFPPLLGKRPFPPKA
jgi:hypothetical protein